MSRMIKYHENTTATYTLRGYHKSVQIANKKIKVYKHDDDDDDCEEKGKCKYSITHFQGYWPWDIDQNLGEIILVALSDLEYLLISGDEYNNDGTCKKFYTDDKIKRACYCVVNGGDWGTMYAVSDNYIYCVTLGFKIRRNPIFETKYKLRSFNLIGEYLYFTDNNNVGIGNRDGHRKLPTKKQKDEFKFKITKFKFEDPFEQPLVKACK
jgi:hypothetical protein